jgi:hypothetical protein
LTCKREAQKTDLKPVEGAVQKLLCGKYLALRVAVSKGSLLVATFQVD